MKWLRLFLLLGVFGVFSFARGRIAGYCEDGAQTVSTLSAISTTQVQRSYPSCTVTVYQAGTLTLASIYSDNLGTSLGNPFTASGTGAWYFYADNNIYDIRLSGGGIITPFVRGSVPIIDPQIIGGVRYADTFSGADACVKIQAAISNLPATGFVDARGFQGTQPCSVNPFAGSTEGVTLLLGAATYVSQVPWVLTNKSRLIGAGRGDPNSLNTVIQAASIFPTNTGVVQLCSASTQPCFGVQVEALTIDCNNVSGCVGAYNAYAEEQSWFRNLAITNAPNVGLFIDGNPPYGSGGSPTFGSQNSGNYSDIHIVANSAAITSTLCIHVLLGIAMHGGLSRITCDATGYTSVPTNAILLEGTNPFIVEDIHVEAFTNGIVLGSAAYGQSQTLVRNIEAGNVTTTVLLPTPTSAQDQTITIMGIRNTTSGANNLVDNVNGNTIPATTDLGYYQIGTGTAHAQTIISDSNTITSRFYGTGVYVLKNFTAQGSGTSTSSPGNNDGGMVFGVANLYKLYSFDGNNGSGGLNSWAPILVTGNGAAPSNGACFLIQRSDGTPGPSGGGLCINGQGYGLDAAVGQVGAGYIGDTGTLTATATSASSVLFKDGVGTLYANSGLTTGSTFSPTSQFTWDSTSPQITPKTSAPTCSTSVDKGRLWYDSTNTELKACVNIGGSYQWQISSLVENTVGFNTVSLGSNSPAVTTTPNSWFKISCPDGTFPCYIPVWK